MGFLLVEEAILTDKLRVEWEEISYWGNEQAKSLAVSLYQLSENFKNFEPLGLHFQRFQKKLLVKQRINRHNIL